MNWLKPAIRLREASYYWHNTGKIDTSFDWIQTSHNGRYLRYKGKWGFEYSWLKARTRKHADRNFLDLAYILYKEHPRGRSMLAAKIMYLWFRLTGGKDWE